MAEDKADGRKSITAAALAKKLDMPKADVNKLILKIPATQSGRRKIGSTLLVDEDAFMDSFDSLTASMLDMASSKRTAGLKAAETRKKAAAKKVAAPKASK